MTRDRGSVLALVPAGFLVLMLLSALAVDSAVAYLGQRQLHDTLAAAATDAATAGVNNGSFYRSGVIALDPAAVSRTVCLSVMAEDPAGLHSLRLWMAVRGNEVELQGTAYVDAVFGRVVPGLSHRGVRAVAVAVASSEPGSAPVGPAPGPLIPVTCAGL